METSAGILVYRKRDDEIEVLLGKCGGPKYEKNSVGAWNIPKGHIDEDEDIISCAFREFNEETSLNLDETTYKDKLIDLGDTVTALGKTVRIFALEFDFNPTAYKVEIKSNECETEWPPKSGTIITVPELSEAYYFKMDVAKRMIFKYQHLFLNRLEHILNDKPNLADKITKMFGNFEEDHQITEEGECGMTCDSVFGQSSGNYPSVVLKKADKGGITTNNINELYTPNTKTPVIGVYRRNRKKK